MGSSRPRSNRAWQSELNVIFSLRDGYVWASWPDGDAAVRLGEHEVVSAMMLDFLAQDELARRLNGGQRGVPTEKQSRH